MARRRNREAAREKAGVELAAGVAGLIAFVVLYPPVRQTVWNVLAPVLVVVLAGFAVAGFVFFLHRHHQRDTHQEVTGRAFRGDLTQILPPAPALAPNPFSPPPPPTPRPRAPAHPAPREPSLAERLREIDWFQFEKLVAALYRTRGYTVTRRGGAHPDGGVDLVAVKAGETALVQCKHWRTSLVKPDKVRELIGAQTIERAHRCVLVTLRGYTEAARQLAREQRVELIEETQLVAWLRETRFSPAWPEIERALDAKDKTCPSCEAPLVERAARSGTNAGKPFWGCSTYPRCDFVFNI